MKNQIAQIFEKEMNRREFLGYIGTAILAAIGITGMLKALLHHGQNQSGNSAAGYGSTVYGGSKKSLL